MPQQELKRRIEQNLIAIRGMRDQMRLDLHLASMEAKDAWKQVERQIEEAERLAGDVTETSRHALLEFAGRVAALRESLERRDTPR